MLNRQFYGALLGSLIIVILIIMTISFYIKIQNNQLMSNTNYIKAELAKLAPNLKSIEEIKKDIEMMNFEKEVLQNIYESQVNLPNILDSIARIIPPGLFLKTISLVNQNIKIEGFADANTTVTKFINNLSAIAWFQELDLSQIKLVPSTSTDPRVQNVTEFILTIKYTPLKNQDLEAKLSGI